MQVYRASYSIVFVLCLFSVHSLISLIMIVPFCSTICTVYICGQIQGSSLLFRVQRSFRLRSFLSLRLGPFHGPCSCRSHEHSDDHHLGSPKQKEKTSPHSAKTMLHRAAHRSFYPLMSIDLKVLDGLECTMEIEMGTYEDIMKKTASMIFFRENLRVLSQSFL